MKAIVTLLVIAASAVILTAPAQAQEVFDIIILRDGTVVKGRIIEIAADRIDYLPSQGPIFGTVPIEQVARIEYGDGRVVTLAPLDEPTPTPPPIVPRGYIPVQPRPESRGIMVNVPLLAVSWAAIGLGTWQAIHGNNVRRDLKNEEAALRAAGLPFKSNRPAFEASKHYTVAGLAYALSLNAFFLAIMPKRPQRPFPVAVSPSNEGVTLAANIRF